MTVKIKDIKPFCKEITRKHIAEKGFRLFKHPTFSSAYIICDSENVLGMVNSSILRDNSQTYWQLKNKNFVPFTF